jgi:hypothetical protein
MRRDVAHRICVARYVAEDFVRSHCVASRTRMNGQPCVRDLRLTVRRVRESICPRAREILA